MERIILRLEQTGANPREGIRGMVGDEDMYLRLLREFLFSEDAGPLRERIEEGDYTGAFAICHHMKGSSVTLALTPLSEALSQLTELLRPYYNKTKKTDPKEERPLIMLALSRTELLLTHYRALLEAFSA